MCLLHLGIEKFIKKASLAVNLGHLEGKIDYFLEIFFIKRRIFTDLPLITSKLLLQESHWTNLL